MGSSCSSIDTMWCHGIWVGKLSGGKHPSSTLASLSSTLSWEGVIQINYLILQLMPQEKADFFSLSFFYISKQEALWEFVYIWQGQERMGRQKRTSCFFCCSLFLKTLFTCNLILFHLFVCLFLLFVLENALLYQIVKEKNVLLTDRKCLGKGRLWNINRRLWVIFSGPKEKLRPFRIPVWASVLSLNFPHQILHLRPQTQICTWFRQMTLM